MSPLDAFPAQRLGNMSEEEFWAFAREQAGGDLVSPSPQNAQTGQYLECVLRQGTCLLPLAAIEEVLPSPARYTLLPAMPRWMPGLTAWRGEVMAVINLEAYLSGIDLPSTGGLLLCTHHAELALGLFLPAIGPSIALDGESNSTSEAQEGRPQGSPPRVYLDGESDLTSEAQVQGRPQGSPPRVHPTPAPTMITKTGVIVKGFVEDVPVLDVDGLLADVVRQIGMAARYG